jgi:hypothetical protein
MRFLVDEHGCSKHGVLPCAKWNGLSGWRDKKRFIESYFG